MIFCDDPSAFPEDLLGLQEVDGAQELPPLWASVLGAERARICKIPEPAAGWGDGLLASAPTGSQFDALRDATAADPLQGRVWCLAGAGGGCRGQHGRIWRALPGNLHLSLGLPADGKVAALGAALNALPAVVAADAVAALLPVGPPPRIKWVNDLVLEGAKVGGMLTAVRRRGEGGEVFLGLGLNVAVAPTLTADRFTPRATCLAEHAAAVPPLSTVLATVLTAVDRRWQELETHGKGPLLTAYRDACMVVGRQVALWPDEGRHQDQSPERGRVTGLDDDLGLIMEDGRILRTGRLALEN